MGLRGYSFDSIGPKTFERKYGREYDKRQEKEITFHIFSIVANILIFRYICPIRIRQNNNYYSQYMDKLQELTQKLYNEGLSKGKEEGQAILEQAKAQAQEILKQAKEEAEAIKAQAAKDAADYRTKVEGDVKTAASQTIQSTRASIESLIVAKAVEPVSNLMSSEDFLKSIITEVAKHFSTQQSQDLCLILPEKLQKNLEPFVSEELAKTVGKGVEATFSKKLAAGFSIGPKDGSYFISLTDESFKALIGEYMRPATKKLLFG